MVIDRTDAVLTVGAGVIRVRTPEGETRRPLRGVSRIILRGSVSLSAAALAALWSADVSLLVLSGRHGSPTARLSGRRHSDAARRLQQYRLLDDPDRRLALSRRLVAAKIAAQARLMVRIADKRPHAPERVRAAQVRLDRALAAVPVAGSLAALRGVEGAAAAATFEGLAAAFPPAVGFTGRNRRPPADPVNACLSLGYTIATAEAARAAETAGLDPMLGVFHDLAWGRLSLACDLMEPLRPRIDGLVLALFRDRTLRKEHFTTEPDGRVLLGKAGRGHFYTAWEAAAPPWRRWLSRAAHALIRDLGPLPDLPEGDADALSGPD